MTTAPGFARVPKSSVSKSESEIVLPSAVSGSATSFAQKIREKAPIMTETYVAYGATRDLVKECTRPGEYKIPQALEKSAEIPTDENGVHLGIGEGWWYESTWPYHILED
jgi:cytochrome b pre-mRNA-processing protein 3